MHSSLKPFFSRSVLRIGFTFFRFGFFFANTCQHLPGGGPIVLRWRPEHGRPAVLLNASSPVSTLLTVIICGCFSSQLHIVEVFFEGFLSTENAEVWLCVEGFFRLLCDFFQTHQAFPYVLWDETCKMKFGSWRGDCFGNRKGHSVVDSTCVVRFRNPYFTVSFSTLFALASICCFIYLVGVTFN